MSSIIAERKKLLESLENGKGVNFILNEGYKILGNPIVMFDTSYNLLAYAGDVATNDPLWKEITTLGTFSHETVDFFNKEGFISAYAESEVVSLMKSDKLKYDRANGKLFDKDGVQLGNILVLASLTPIGDEYLALIEILCGILSVELQNSEFYQRIDRVYQESVLSDLIDGKIRKTEIENAKIAGLQREMKAYLHLAVVDISQYEHTITHLAYFRDLFKKMQPEYQYYIHLNNIVIIIDTDDPMLSIENDMVQLNEFFSKYSIYAGISSGFHDLSELRKYYREAICALNYGSSGMGSRRAFSYDNFRVERFLNTAKHTVEINDIYNPVIFLLQEYDRENDASLLKLLYSYLLHGKDSALTCRMMEITASELNRQLMILEESFGIDWKDGDMLSNIFISIKMLDSLLS